MSIRLADLPEYKDRFVQVEYDTGEASGDECSRVITGKLIGVGPTAIVVQTRNNAEMIKREDLLEVEEVLRYTAKDALIIRKLAKVTVESVRQHLLDRHGVEASTVRELKDDEAMTVHNIIAHSVLGHVHGPTEKGKPGRKPKRQVADDANPVQLQGQDKPDGDPAHVHD